MPEALQIRVHGEAALPTLVYLPGLHGDWTLIGSFRQAVEGRARFVEFTYPRTTEWTLRDYADAVEHALTAHGITNGWLLGESYGSQVAWAILGRDELRESQHFTVRGGTPETPLTPPSPLVRRGERVAAGRVRSAAVSFQPSGLILAGGFVTYPGKWRVRLTARFIRRAGPAQIRWFLGVYARYARFRHRHAPETLAGVAEFVSRRTEEDRQAMLHRLRLIGGNDATAIALQAALPVFHLAGAFDPVVPAFAVRRWLRAHCPGYRATRIVFPADHNVLSTEPRQSAEQVLRWVGATR
jgi:pimeloyl-ACP methyl ester carboxylesterase